MKYLKIYGVYYIFEDSQSFLKMFHISEICIKKISLAVQNVLLMIFSR